MFQKLLKKKEKKEKCYSCQDKGKAINGYRVTVNDIKCTLQIIGNKNDKDFGVLLNEIPINYCPICRKKANNRIEVL